MNRRRLLTQIGMGTTVIGGGCMGYPNAVDDTTETLNPPLDDQQCPPYATGRDRAVCSHTVDPDTASVYLAPDSRSSTLDDGMPVDEITLTLYNQSTTDLRFNPQSWRIWHRSGDNWTELDQQQAGDGVVTVSAGESFSWSFLEAVTAIRNDPELDSGHYAAEIGAPDPNINDKWIACIALLRFESSE